MKKILTGLMMLLALTVAAQALAGNTPQRPLTSTAGAHVVDDFEDGTFLKSPEWWVFDNIDLTITSDKKLWIRGKASDWYVGGLGTYLFTPGKDLSKYSAMDLDIWGTGPHSGTLKIELYDDDNGNEQIEQDPKKGYAPIYDDRFSYELKVDWKGYRHVSIPFFEFVDNNPDAGDNVWNPQQMRGSGGLLQMQLIVVATSKTGRVDMTIDNIAFAAGNNKKR